VDWPGSVDSNGVDSNSVDLDADVDAANSDIA